MPDEQPGLRSDPDQAMAGLYEGIAKARRLAHETEEALREIQLNMAARVDVDVADVVRAEARPG